jgi:Tol biopolymer transport system component
LALSAGTRLGAYEILGPLGAGGMGEVYRAADTNLGRQVAIKALPSEVAGDPERMARFRREATLLASLNHPNVASIYGLEEAGGQPFLVLELVEGEDLAERLRRGPLPVDDAVGVARQITEALEEAHSKGIVHRDLKPANVKLTPEGRVKVLDFGLAKAWEADPDAGSSGDLSQSPTLARSGTLAGVVLGTAAYMSPEQAKGKRVDRRSDVWAFGALVYELLTAQRAFPGEDVSDTLAAVLRGEPDFAKLPKQTPATLRRVLELCLTRDLDRRVHDIADVRLAMDGAFDPAPASAPAPSQTPRLWAVAALASLATGLLVWGLAGRRSPPAREVVRLTALLPSAGSLARLGRPVFAVSPDGRRLAYATAEGVYLRSMDELDAQLLPGTEQRRLQALFFSADGASIGFQEGQQLKRLDLSGGTPIVICPVRDLLGAHWAPDGTILFADLDGISSVPAAGGVPKLLVEAGEGELLVAPQPLPGGSSVLLTIGDANLSTSGFGRFVIVGWENSRIAVASLATGERTTLLTGGSDARYVPSGHIVYADDDGLSAVTFDASSLRVTSDPTPLVEGVKRPSAWAHYSVTDDGTLVYLAASPEERAPLVWVDRTGSAEAIGTLPADAYEWPRLSPDGERLLALVRGDAWVFDLASGRQLRLTEDGATDYLGWTPSGEQVTFTSFRGSALGEIWIQAADASRPARQLTALGGRVDFDSWAPDGRTFAAHQHLGSAIHQLMVAFDGESATPETWLEHDYADANAVFSPDGRYVAYLSAQTGRPEIFIRPYPGPGGQTPVSIHGGAEPVWARTGELFYRRGRDYALMAVQVATDPVLRVGAPVELFAGTAPPAGSSTTPRYDVTRDGQRFVMSQRLLATGEGGARDDEPAVVVVVQNWVEELKRRLPVD